VTLLQSSDVSVLASIAEDPERAQSQAEHLLGLLRDDAAKEIARVLMGLNLPASEDAQITAKALLQWVESNKNPKNRSELVTA
jgi:hypothetical protein